jgi:hypothetical protein
MSEQKKRTVHYHMFNPAKAIFKSLKRDRAKYHSVVCDDVKCGLLENNTCSMAGTFIARCPYGKRHSDTGFTVRARKFSKWIRDHNEKYKGIKHLSSPKNKVAIVGDYYFLPYPFMMINTGEPFGKDGGFFKDAIFIKKEKMTIDNIINICNFTPHAIMGGVITRYQEEVVPLFIKHLSEVVPDVFEKLCAKYERARVLHDNYSYIGRNAILDTIVPLSGKLIDIHGGEWIWDGEYLTSTNSRASFLLVDSFTECRIKPEHDQVVKITDDAQVGPGTKLID